MGHLFHRITSLDEYLVRSALVFAAAICWILPANAHAATGYDASAAASCEALKAEDFSGVTDAPTEVTDAGVVTPGDGSASYCRVAGYVANQIGSPTPNILERLRPPFLPDRVCP